MYFCLITFRSITPAQRGERVLRQAGFDTIISRTPKWMEEQGCGYSLRVRCSDAIHCVEKLRNEKVAFRKIYRLKDNGKAEEMVL